MLPVGKVNYYVVYGQNIMKTNNLKKFSGIINNFEN